MTDLIDALQISNRTAQGLATTLRQLDNGDLDKLYPIEKRNIIRNSLENHEKAKKIADEILKAAQS